MNLFRPSLAGILTFAMLAPCAGAQHVAFNTSAPLYHHAANASRGYEDLIVPGIVIANDRRAAFVVDSVRVEVLAGGRLLAAIMVDPREIRSATEELSQMRGMGLTAVVDMAIAPGVLGAQPALATGDTVRAGSSFIGPVSYVAVRGAPEVVRVRVDLHGADAKPVTAWSTDLRVIAPPAARIAFPLNGAWYARSIPNITSHHRWNAQTEFALDFWKVDANGAPFRDAGSQATDFYGFGQPVSAADDGEVVSVENEAVQDWAVRLQRPGESREEYGRRLSRFNMQSMSGDVHKAVMGNYVVLAHANGLFTAYAHLKQGSVIVAKGDHVARGQQIASVGDTGDSQLVHLHFQLCDGPDPLAAHTIPFTFSNASIDVLDLGSFVRPIVPPRP